MLSNLTNQYISYSMAVCRANEIRTFLLLKWIMCRSVHRWGSKISVLQGPNVVKMFEILPKCENFCSYHALYHEFLYTLSWGKNYFLKNHDHNIRKFVVYRLSIRTLLLGIVRNMKIGGKRPVLKSWNKTSHLRALVVIT